MLYGGGRAGQVDIEEARVEPVSCWICCGSWSISVLASDVSVVRLFNWVRIRFIRLLSRVDPAVNIDSSADAPDGWRLFWRFGVGRQDLQHLIILYNFVIGPQQQ